ncbi:hypothetical protein ACM66B_004383 [Microbotryomycetes sp. NB124-2]
MSPVVPVPHKQALLEIVRKASSALPFKIHSSDFANELKLLEEAEDESDQDLVTLLLKPWILFVEHMGPLGMASLGKLDLAKYETKQPTPLFSFDKAISVVSAQASASGAETSAQAMSPPREIKQLKFGGDPFTFANPKNSPSEPARKSKELR